MVSEIRIYIEGGGDSRSARDELRRGFGTFFRSLRDLARSRRIGWRIALCGSRESAYGDFVTALQTHPNSFNVLLVDAEAPVTVPPWKHLCRNDGWSGSGTGDDHCHLMVQLSETWFIADIGTLSSFYGAQFNPNPIPGNARVETVPKDAVLEALKKATRSTQKGEYHKIRHAALLLEKIDVAVVRRKAPHCDRLFNILTNRM